MTVFTVSHQIHDNTGSSFTTQQDDQIASIGAGFKITKIQVQGEISFDAIGTYDDTAATFFSATYTHGVQYGPAGGAFNPIGSGADYDDAPWFYGALPAPAAAIAAWAPNTDHAGVADRWPFTVTVYPQYLVPSGGIFIAYSVGPTVTGLTQGYRRFVSTRVWYHG